MLNNEDLRKIWTQNYANVDQTLDRMSKVKSVATAFNANIDAVVKISGETLQKLIAEFGLTKDDLHRGETKLLDGPDVIRGVFKCFERGIAEEWLTEDRRVFDWMVKHIGYDHLQMGGQGGIVANALAAAGVGKVYVHTNSLPKMQADLFLDYPNLYSFDEKGKIKKAHEIDREKDVPLIHWILEFNKGDYLELDGQTIFCPKSNRFIATYDPLNLKLVKDQAFVDFSLKNPLDYIVLSGFHALTENRNGVALVEEVVPLIEGWKKVNPKGIVHLEVASTQDFAVRKAIVEKIAPKVDSAGLNERETIDVLQVIGEDDLAKVCDEKMDGVHLLQALLKVKNALRVPRVQLHMFGIYITLQDKGFRISPEENRNGMCLAAVTAAGKASLGKVETKADFVYRKDFPVTDDALDILKDVANFVGNEALCESGIIDYEGYDLIAIPTILVPKPVTLVGMGDTISSISLVGAR